MELPSGCGQRGLFQKEERRALPVPRKLHRWNVYE